jgi:hypothetical protein
MKTLTKIILVLLAVFIVIQFIRPERNSGAPAGPADMMWHVSVPPRVAQVLKASCYDCHSNTTHYPWYTNLQPVSWWLAHHIKEGKEELNFNEFGTYSPRRQRSKLKAIGDSVKDGSMPLASYTLMHKEAVLSDADKALIIDWASRTMDSLKLKR